MRKVGINLLWMVPGEVGGTETYFARLLSGLAERSSELDYTLFALRSFADAHPDLARTFKTAYARVGGQSRALRVAAESSWLPLECRSRKIDLIHHAGGVIPFMSGARPVLTIHDLQYLYYPEYFTRTKLRYLRAMVPRSASVAHLILTPSQFTRRTVVEHLGIDSDRVVVVPHGISPREGKEPAREIRGRYDIHGAFFLYPAITYLHKNHLVLIEAFAKLVREYPDLTLVLTGARGSHEVRVAHQVKKLGLEGNVRRLGYLPARDLDALYHEAVALVFPSRFEGFGAPILEAMSRGCPVIAADATALPEVVGQAGCLVSPDDAHGWYEAMRELLEDDEERARQAKAGLERAREFTWSRSVDVLEAAYLRVLESP